MTPGPLQYSPESTPALKRVVSRYRSWGIVCLCLTGVAIIYVVAIATAGGGLGSFSPDTFQYRTQSEVLLPLTSVPLYRSGCSYHQPPLFQYLVAQGYWAPSGASDPKWLPAFRWNRQWKDGYSGLHRELSWRGPEWINWSKSHPEMAAELWPLLLEVLRADAPAGDVEGHARWLLYAAGASRDIAEFRSLAEAVEGEGVLDRRVE
jgi:hypothetical protein